MSQLDIQVYEGNDPSLLFTIKANGAAIDLTGATVEFYIKENTSKSDTDPSTVKLSTTGGQITILSPATAGQCRVDVTSANLGGLKQQVYRLDVIKSSRRLTYSHGKLLKVNV